MGVVYIIRRGGARCGVGTATISASRRQTRHATTAALIPLLADVRARLIRHRFGVKAGRRHHAAAGNPWI
jgi:hypothetical protein